jgi:hypothetical protein
MGSVFEPANKLTGFVSQMAKGAGKEDWSFEERPAPFHQHDHDRMDLTNLLDDI